MDLSKLNWHDIDYFNDIPEKALFWIKDNQSLTQKLKNRYPDFRVEVQQQEELDLYKHEINQLGKEENFIVREVFLYGDNEPVVFARSVIPKNTKTDSIMEIGNKPLGEILFTNSNISREPIEITFHNDIWGRRSVFIMNNSRILVSEFFLEKIYA